MKRKQAAKEDRDSNLIPLFGRDEMNLIEFPIGPITLPEKKTIEVEHLVRDRKTRREIIRKLTITGSDAFGLPKPIDDQVLLGMMTLTYEAGFASRKVEFSRYHLCQILGWPTDGRSYKRLEDSFDRIHATAFKFKDAWWDNSEKQYRTHSFHLIENVELCSIDRYGKVLAETRQKAHSLCKFVWNEVVWKSFQDGNIKKVDMEMFRRIANGRRREVPLRLFRWLDKQFWNAEVVRFDAMKLGVGTLGIAPGYPSDVVRVIRRASEVLIKCRFLASAKVQTSRNGNAEFVFVKQGRSGSMSVPREPATNQSSAKPQDGLLEWSRLADEKELADMENLAIDQGFGTRFERQIVSRERELGIPIRKAGRTRLLYLKKFIDESSKRDIALAG